MPLTATRSLPELSVEREAVGVWMDAGDRDFVRLFASRRGLEDFRPNQLIGDEELIAIFASHRLQIEEAASTKFDRDGADEDDRYQEKAVLMVRLGDIPDGSRG